MYIRCFFMSRRRYRNLLHTGIVLVWIAGLALGFAAERFYGDVYCGQFELAPTCSPDFWGLAVVNLFPLLISAFAVWINPRLIYLLCLLRGMSLGLGLCACAKLYGQAGLMMASLLMFSLTLFSPVLLWYWSGVLSWETVARRRNTAVCCGIALVLALVDLWVIAPFLQEVMNF